MLIFHCHNLDKSLSLARLLYVWGDWYQSGSTIQNCILPNAHWFVRSKIPLDGPATDQRTEHCSHLTNVFFTSIKIPQIFIIYHPLYILVNNENWEQSLGRCIKREVLTQHSLHLESWNFCGGSVVIDNNEYKAKGDFPPPDHLGKAWTGQEVAYITSNLII